MSRKHDRKKEKYRQIASSLSDIKRIFISYCISDYCIYCSILHLLLDSSCSFCGSKVKVLIDYRDVSEGDSLELRVQHLDGSVRPRVVVCLDALAPLEGRWQLFDLVPGAQVLGPAPTSPSQCLHHRFL